MKHLVAEDTFRSIITQFKAQLNAAHTLYRNNIISRVLSNCEALKISSIKTLDYCMCVMADGL